MDGNTGKESCGRKELELGVSSESLRGSRLTILARGSGAERRERE